MKSYALVRGDIDTIISVLYSVRMVITLGSGAFEL